MKINNEDVRVIRESILDTIKFLESEWPGEGYAKLKGLYTSYYLMEGNSYFEAVEKAANMTRGVH